MPTAYIALGSNQGDRMLNLGRAVDALSDLEDTRVTAVSHAYESEPAYVQDQALFANAVVAMETDLESEQLLAYLQQIEDSMGRVRAEKNGPRLIDLDILLLGDEDSHTPNLTIPHPRLLERDFVVTPLLEIAPRIQLPDGTRVTRDNATIGPVIGDLGPVPDVGALHNDPVLPGEWVDVADGTRDQDVVAGWDPQLMLVREVMEQSEIPYRWDPYEPESTTDPFGLPTQFRILVPASYREHALEVIAAVMAAEPQFPADQMGEE
ncbi:MAG: 2-amino-4-hydroxy-6-hydroxymethyldihydropteridine diphosphokinase [Coriobacteriia bacterium]